MTHKMEDTDYLLHSRTRRGVTGSGSVSCVPFDTSAVLWWRLTIATRDTPSATLLLIYQTFKLTQKEPLGKSIAVSNTGGVHKINPPGL